VKEAAHVHIASCIRWSYWLRTSIKELSCSVGNRRSKGFRRHQFSILCTEVGGIRGCETSGSVKGLQRVHSEPAANSIKIEMREIVADLPVRCSFGTSWMDSHMLQRVAKARRDLLTDPKTRTTNEIPSFPRVVESLRQLGED
jgi:hypothetical protein